MKREIIGKILIYGGIVLTGLGIGLIIVGIMMTLK